MRETPARAGEKLRRQKLWPLIVFSVAFAGCGAGGSSDDVGTDGGVAVDVGTDAAAVSADAGTDTGPDARAPVDAALVGDASSRDDTGACADDDAEDDDTLAAALAAPAVYAIGRPATLTGRVSCPGDDDFVHGFEDCCGDALGAEITWAAADGTLQLEVLAPDGSPWPVDDTADEPGRARRVETASVLAHDFVVRIHNPGATRIVYDASIFATVTP